MSPILESDRICLTAITNDDLPQFATWLSDFGLQRLVNPGMSMPHDEVDYLKPDNWLQASLKDEKSRTFAIRTLQEDVFIGTCALIHLNMFTHCAEIGINLAHPDYRSKGYGGEIMKLLMRYGFEQFNLNRINLGVMGFNTRAMRLYERLGFKREVVEREIFFHDGKYFDGLLMGILRTEWEENYV